MFCGNCGGKLDSNGLCSNCAKTVTKQPLVNQEINNNDNSNKNNKRIFIIIGAIVSILLVGVLLFVLLANNNNSDDKKRSKTLENLEKNEYLKFTLDDNDFYIGDKVSIYKSKNISYNDKYVDENSKISSDSIMSQTFYNVDEDAQFLGAMYCPAGNDCDYDDTKLIKANFYKDSNVVVNGKLKFGMTYNDVVRLYGDEDGTFYQDSDLLVWTFGEKGKIGEPYYILRFDNGGIWSLGDLYEIRIGVWWYEGEYEHTVIKGKEGDK